MNRGLGYLQIVGMLVASACNRDHAATSIPTPAFQRVSLSVFQYAADTTLDPGECRMTPQPEYPPSYRAVTYLVPGATGPARRILVVMDSAGAVRRYSDIRRTPAGTTDIEVDFHDNVGMVVQPIARVMVRSSPTDIYESEQIGLPKHTAELVRRACGV